MERSLKRFLGLDGGVVGRVRFLAGLSLVFFATVILTVIVAVCAYFLHWPGAVWTPIMALVLFVLLSVSLLALSARRLRDIGWPPCPVLGGLMLVYALEAFGPSIAWPSPVRELTSAPLTLLGVWILGFVLVLWPGRAEGGERRSGLVLPGAIATLLIGGVCLGLIFDPSQGRTCPVYGAGAPSDDCESLGVIGRYYSSYLVVDANKRLGDQKPERALKGLKAAIAVRPQFVYAYNSMGLAYDQLNDTTRALEAYDRALALQPAYVNGLMNRAVLLDKLGQRPRALADLRTILRHEPGNAIAQQGVTYMTGERR